MTALDVHDGGKNRGNERYSDESVTSSHALKGCPEGQLFASQKAGRP